MFICLSRMWISLKNALSDIINSSPASPLGECQHLKSTVTVCMPIYTLPFENSFIEVGPIVGRKGVSVATWLYHSFVLFFICCHCKYGILKLRPGYWRSSHSRIRNVSSSTLHLCDGLFMMYPQRPLCNVYGASGQSNLQLWDVLMWTKVRSVILSCNKRFWWFALQM